MRAIFLLGGILLAGCAAFDQDAAFTNPDCRQAIYADPLVSKGIVSSAISRSPANGQDENTTITNGQERFSLAAAKQRAYNACLRGKGLLRGGGVQAVEK